MAVNRTASLGLIAFCEVAAPGIWAMMTLRRHPDSLRLAGGKR